MLTKLRERSQSESGFTLIELLVVMLILGILAAIAIPAFFNQRDKAQDSDAKVTARTAETAMETYATDNGGDYTGADADDLHAIEATLPDNAAGTLTVAYPGAPALYSVTAESDTENTFTITRNDDGTKTLTCETEGDAGCPEGGDWSGD
jgi:type IV pilus assembly protein PilA